MNNRSCGDTKATGEHTARWKVSHSHVAGFCTGHLGQSSSDKAASHSDIYKGPGDRCLWLLRLLTGWEQRNQKGQDGDPGLQSWVSVGWTQAFACKGPGSLGRVLGC